MTRKRSHRDSRPINPYKVTDEDALAEEFKNIDYEPPVFSIPELDRILAGTDAEAEQMIKLYRLEEPQRTMPAGKGQAVEQGLTWQELIDLIMN